MRKARRGSRPAPGVRVLAVARPELGARILPALSGVCRPVVAGLGEDLPRLCAGLEPGLLIIELGGLAPGLGGLAPGLGGPPPASAESLKSLRDDFRLRHIPILALGTDGSEAALLRVLRSGADDFLPEPFEPAELRGRVQALLRRGAGGRIAASRLKVGALSLDLDAGRARLNGRPLKLTWTEFLILADLMRRAGAVVARSALAASVWGARQANGHTLESHVSNLRRKLGPFAGMLQTAYGDGWRCSGAPLK